MPALRDGRLERSGHILVFDEDWEGPDLDPRRWIPTYLPHWSSRVYELPRPDGRPSARTGPYPKEAVVHHVRGYAPRHRAVGDGPGGG